MYEVKWKMGYNHIEKTYIAKDEKDLEQVKERIANVGCVLISVEKALQEVELGQYYRNKKTGDIYYTINFVKHSETLETMVSYILAKGEDKTEWVRPLDLFKIKFEEM